MISWFDGLLPCRFGLIVPHIEANIGIFSLQKIPVWSPQGTPGAGAEASPHGQHKTLLQTPQNQNIPRQ